MVWNARCFLALNWNVVVLIDLRLLCALDIKQHVMVELIVLAKINSIVAIGIRNYILSL